MLPLQHHRSDSPENVSPPALLDRIMKTSVTHRYLPGFLEFSVSGLNLLSSPHSLCLILINDAGNFFKSVDCQPGQL